MKGNIKMIKHLLAKVILWALSDVNVSNSNQKFRFTPIFLERIEQTVIRVLREHNQDSPT